MKKLILAFICLLLAVPCGARIITVDDDGPADFSTIQAAINDANDGDTIIVADGIYTGPGNRDIDFLGKAITVRSENGPNNCIIDCQNSGRGFYFHNNEDANSIVDGFTITNGYNDGGGAIYCKYSSPTISYCTITGNSVEDVGGGIYCRDSSPIITNCTITNNSAEKYVGGGMCNQNNSSPTVTNCIFSGNSAGYFGGGMCSGGGSPTVTSCTFSRNTAGYSGGGMDNGGSSPTVTNCTFSANTVGYSGGGMDNGDSSPTVTNCTFSGNSAEQRGGGMDNWWSSPTVTNCTFSGNSASNGSALACNSLGLPSTVLLTNCILWDGGQQIWNNDGSTITISYTDLQGGQADCYDPWDAIEWGLGNIDADPCFAFSTDYHIMPSSPCIDAGNPDYIPEPNETDLDGNPRVIGGRIDMGAHEYNPNAPSIIAVSAVSFYFTLAWPKPEPQTLFIRNAGGQTLHWEIVEDCNWLQISPANGVSTGQIEEVILTVDPNGLAEAVYRCSFEVRDPNASNNPVTVRVTMFMSVGAVLRVPSQDFDAIQDAIDAADNYDIVLVADGTYTGEGNKNLDFKGKPITVCSENGPNSCIINCQNLGCGFYFHNNEDANSIVDGFTITNGYSGAGGGIYCGYSSPTITNCIITGNSADGYGGGICNWYSHPTITNCSFSENLTTRYDGCGGGMYNWYSHPTITNCTFTENSATWGGGMLNHGYSWEGYGWPTVEGCTFSGNSADGGGGMLNYGSNPIVTNCTFSRNSAEYYCGGGMYNSYRSHPTITNCTFGGNSAYSYGGGMYNHLDSSPTLTNCTFSGNSAEERGGGMYNFESRPTLVSCKFSGNRAYEYGGGMCNYGWCRPTLTNCTFSGNSAANNGGGMYNSESHPTLVSCKFSGNRAYEYGGGMCNYEWCRPTLTNCTFAENSARDGNALACDSYEQRYPSNVEMTNCILWDGGNEVWNNDNSIITITYSNVQGGWFGEGNIDADPRFIEPGYWADLNDPNIIVEPNDPNAIWLDGDYHLLPDSPSIDAGDPNYILEPNETDLDGNPRIIGGQIDMGAYETNYIEAAMKFTPQTLNCNSRGNWVKAHLTLPEGFVIEDMDANTPGVIVLLGIESDYINVFINEDGLVELEIGFERAAFCAAGIDYGPAEVMVIGKLTSGQDFYGTDTIRIIGNNLKYLAVFASYWLDVDCGKPDWCGGVDLDRNSVVDFVDFALFAKDWLKQTTWHE